MLYENSLHQGAWVTRSVECPTLDFGSGHDPRVVGLSPAFRLCAECGACLRFSLSAPIPALSLSKKLIIKEKVGKTNDR